MNPRERSDNQVGLSRRAFIKRGLIFIGAASLGLNCELSGSEEDKNTKMAERFMTALSVGDTGAMYELFHPEIKNRTSLESFTLTMQTRIKDYSICKGSKLKKVGYRSTTGNEEGDLKITFATEPVCQSSNRTISSVEVVLKRTANGYAVRYLSY